MCVCVGGWGGEQLLAEFSLSIKMPFTRIYEKELET